MIQYHQCLTLAERWVKCRRRLSIRSWRAQGNTNGNWVWQALEHWNGSPSDRKAVHETDGKVTYCVDWYIDSLHWKLSIKPLSSSGRGRDNTHEREGRIHLDIRTEEQSAKEEMLSPEVELLPVNLTLKLARQRLYSIQCNKNNAYLCKNKNN